MIKFKFHYSFTRNRPTTEDAIGSLQKTLEQLDAVENAENDEVIRLDYAIFDAEEARTEAVKRRDRAQNIASRLAALLA
jgi:hypothetical protein